MKAFLTICLLGFSAYSLQAGVEDLVRKGDVHDKRFESAEALKYYLPAEKLDPDNADLLVKIARQYVYEMDETSDKNAQMTLGKTALAYAGRAIKLAPKKSDSWLAEAICWGKLTPLLSVREQMEASRKIKIDAEEAVKLDVSNDYAWHLLGRWHQALAAMSTFKKGLAQAVYGSLPNASNEDALKCFQKAVALNPNRLIHYIELGRTYAQMDKPDEARIFIQKGLSMPNREKDDSDSKLRGKQTLDTLK